MTDAWCLLVSSAAAPLDSRRLDDNLGLPSWHGDFKPLNVRKIMWGLKVLGGIQLVHTWNGARSYLRIKGLKA